MKFIAQILRFTQDDTGSCFVILVKTQKIQRSFVPCVILNAVKDLPP